MYPLEMRFGFNNKLLNLKENQKTEVYVDSMTPEEMKKFIKKMIGIYIYRQLQLEESLIR